MELRPTLAAQNYASIRPATQPDPNGTNAAGQATQSFADLVRAGETTAQQAMTGAADPHALVQALAQTELAVEAAVAVRNKVVEAYQEILRMPI